MVPGNWEAIIDAETWDKVRAIREADPRRQALLGKRMPGPFLLTGLLYCGYCGRRLVHRARKSRDGMYLCVEQGGKRCPGGSVCDRNADDFVTQRFLERCAFKIEGRGVQGFGDRERAWEKASMADRRALLSLAIARVVVQPWPGGDAPKPVWSQRRSISVEWVSEAPPNDQLLFIKTEEPPPKPHRQVSEGRSEMMRELEVRKRSAQRYDRSERARKATSDWSDQMRTMRESRWAKESPQRDAGA